jgi:hypothetical protein
MCMVIVLSACGPPRDVVAASDPKCRFANADREFCRVNAVNALGQCRSEHEARYGHQPRPYLHECVEPYNWAIDNCNVANYRCY